MPCHRWVHIWQTICPPTPSAFDAPNARATRYDFPAFDASEYLGRDCLTDQARFVLSLDSYPPKHESSRMRYVILVGLLGLAIAVDLAVFMTASDDALEPFDRTVPPRSFDRNTSPARPRSPGARTDVHALFDLFAAGYRKQLQPASETPSPEP